MNKTLRRILSGVVAALSLSAAGVGLQAAPAGNTQPQLAAYTSRSIAITSDVHIRPSPDTSQPWLTTMPAGSHPQYICYVDGENEQGTTKWFRVNWNGVTGYLG